jgi:hypothetical protein
MITCIHCTLAYKFSYTEHEVMEQITGVHVRRGGGGGGGPVRVSAAASWPLDHSAAIFLTFIFAYNHRKFDGRRLSCPEWKAIIAAVAPDHTIMCQLRP